MILFVFAILIPAGKLDSKIFLSGIYKIEDIQISLRLTNQFEIVIIKSKYLTSWWLIKMYLGMHRDILIHIKYYHINLFRKNTIMIMMQVLSIL